MAVVYRTVPDQEHMALILYTESLPMSMHDSIMEAIESPEGQESNSLADVLFRKLLKDGRPILETVYRESMLKKVECKQIIVTPNASSHIRLDELNKILAEMESGDEARQKLENLDANAGFVDPTGNTTTNNATTEQPNGVLGDDMIAKQRLTQAINMEAESKSLLAESKLLKAEAYRLDESLKPKRAVKKKAAVKKTTVKTTAKKRAATKKATKKTTQPATEA